MKKLTRKQKALQEAINEVSTGAVQAPKFSRKVGTLHPMNHKQQEAMDALNAGVQVVFLTGSAGTGKAQPLTSKIFTPNGWVFMGDMRVGDTVRSQSGWTTVTGVFPQGSKPVYRVSTKDGGSTLACSEHLWTVDSNVGSRISRLNRKVQKTITTLELKTEVEKKSKGTVTLPRLSSIEMPEVYLPVDPYLLGVLIGDGSIVQPTPTVYTADTEIMEEVSSRLPSQMAVKDLKHKYGYSIVNSETALKRENHLTSHMKSLGLYGKYSHDKFVPKIYKDSSVSQRYELLQGLLDTDGTVGKRVKEGKSGSVVFTTTSPYLAEDVREIVLSLGGRVKISPKRKTYTYKGEKLLGRVSYDLSINVEDKKRLFKLKRKQRLIGNKDTSQGSRFIESVEYVGEMECQCISVSDPTHLYVTDDYILTHNTLLATHSAAKRLADGTAKKVYLVRPAVAVGKSIGLLPGEIDEKLAPYFAQTRAHLESFLGAGYTQYAFDKKTIEMQPVEYLRGRSFESCVVIVEEAQNFTAEEMEMMLTRIGQGCTMIFTGDQKQHDMKGQSGLRQCLDLIERMTRDHPSYLTREDIDELADNIAVIKFGPEHVVRSGLARAVVRMYHNN
jgi:phosphate starvation-inducible protein PhoH